MAPRLEYRPRGWSVCDDRVSGVVDPVHRVAVCMVNDVKRPYDMRHADRVVANERIIASIHGTVSGGAHAESSRVASKDCNATDAVHQ